MSVSNVSIGRILAAFCGLLGGCGTLDYSKVEEGELSGTLFVMWVDGSKGPGSGKFVYVPDLAAPLSFTWRDPSGRKWEIKPEMMYTDGGSIPRIAQGLKGMDPWGYGPAYVLHDWIYLSRYCITDKIASAEQLRIEEMDFDTSGAILAAAIKTLIQRKQLHKDDVVPSLISAAVSGPYAKSLWKQQGECAHRAVSAEHRTQIENSMLRPMMRSGPRKDGPRIIASFEF